MIINTIHTKEQQLKNGYFKTGSGNETILIIGSCRAVPYVNYLNDWNEQNHNRFSICFIDPFNWNWDMQENRTNYKEELIKQETNAALLDVLKNCSIFIHEYYANAEMFNCDKAAEKNIYQFGLNPKQDITLPNYNDIFILTKEIVSFDVEIRKLAIQDYNVNGKLSDYTIQKIRDVREKNLQKFYDICAKTDFPEFADIFKNEHEIIRYAHTFNHVTKRFNQRIFFLMNEKFLHLDLSKYTISEVDLFDNSYTELCEYDLDYYWNEKIKPLKESL